jgi:hypothetical protein
MSRIPLHMNLVDLNEIAMVHAFVLIVMFKAFYFKFAKQVTIILF